MEVDGGLDVPGKWMSVCFCGWKGEKWKENMEVLEEGCELRGMPGCRVKGWGPGCQLG